MSTARAHRRSCRHRRVRLRRRPVSPAARVHARRRPRLPRRLHRVSSAHALIPCAPPSRRACAASRRGAGATASDRRAACRRSGRSRSSWSRSRRSRCAAPACRTPGTAGRTCRAPPSPGRNAVTFSGKPSPTSSRSRSVHSASTRARRRVAARAISSSVELLRQRHRRQLGAMQDLVGVGVADAGEERGSVSERLSVWFSRRSAAANCVGRRGRAARGRRDRARRAPRAPRTRCSDARFFDARLGQDQRPAREVERREPDLAGNLGAAPGFHFRRPGDHQVQDEEQIVLEHEDDALAEALACRRRACRTSSASGGSTERSRNGLAEPHLLERAAPTTRRRRARRRP